MEPNPIELFLHIFGVIGIFVGYGTLILGMVALRRSMRAEEVRAIAGALTAGRRIGFEHISAIDAVVVASVLLITATGLDMARSTGDWRSGWARVAIASLLLMAPLGPFVINPRLQAIARTASSHSPGPVSASLRSRLEDPILTLTLRASFMILIGLVFLMTVKPSLPWSVFVVLLALVAGGAWAAAGKVLVR